MINKYGRVSCNTSSSLGLGDNGGYTGTIATEVIAIIADIGLEHFTIKQVNMI